MDVCRQGDFTGDCLQKSGHTHCADFSKHKIEVGTNNCVLSLSFMTCSHSSGCWKARAVLSSVQGWLQQHAVAAWYRPLVSDLGSEIEGLKDRKWV